VLTSEDALRVLFPVCARLPLHPDRLERFTQNRSQVGLDYLFVAVPPFNLLFHRTFYGFFAPPNARDATIVLVIGVSVRIEPSVSLVDLQATEPLINLRKQSRKQRRPHPLTRFVHDEVLANFECHVVQVPLRCPRQRDGRIRHWKGRAVQAAAENASPRDRPR
jgi:hypothetical protein